MNVEIEKKIQELKELLREADHRALLFIASLDEDGNTIITAQPGLFIQEEVDRIIKVLDPILIAAGSRLQTTVH